ncbi:protein phosphatase 2C domain-containing protein [Longispora sp. NPDC051575]|uniref:PP2C family protein-serine/threonine phosphatase n=1 Tax=Longispora sp. NPDC051575 TaxID=3154943 RepID=UPI0034250DE0
MPALAAPTGDTRPLVHCMTCVDSAPFAFDPQTLHPFTCPECVELFYDPRNWGLAARDARTGQALDRGDRLWQADAVATHVDPMTRRAAWALADGVGDSPAAQFAGSFAAWACAVSAVHTGPAGALANARAAWHLLTEERAEDGERGSAAVVVAAPTTGGGVVVSWAGDARAYALTSDEKVYALTVDHTVAEDERRSGRTVTPGTPGEHLLTSSLRHGHIGATTFHRPVRRLLLCSDGVHRRLGFGVVTRALQALASPEATARALTLASRQGRAHLDNAAALVIDLP